MSKKYEFICSLGMDCGMAGILEDLGVRSFSSPFDWLDGSDIATRANLIKNKFENFFNFEDFEPIIFDDDPQKDKRRFKNKRTKLNFHHDWNSTQTFEEGFKEVKEKYERRIARLLNFIDKNRGGNVCFR